MNEQDEQLLIRYLQYRRKMKIIIFLIILFVVIASVILLKINFEKPTDNTVIQENIIENSENEIVTNNLTNSISTVLDEVKEEKEVETITQTETKPKPVNENAEKVVETTKPTNNTSSERKEEDKKTNKPANKDFLFIDGYNMDNVTQAAQQYLKASGYAGECIPLKDNEGIYIGMRVVFY